MWHERLVRCMTKHHLSRDAIRRVLLSLITVLQDALIKQGALGQGQSLAFQTMGYTHADIDSIEIDEASLGFDSLSRLDLVLAVNQFFQLHTTGVEDYLLIRRKIGDWVDLVEQHFDIVTQNAQIAFQTSGSTAEPKTIIHAFQTLQTEIYALLSGPVGQRPRSARIISLVPPHHMYGFLFSCLLPSMTGNETISLYQQTPTRCFTLARDGDLVIATPFIWNKLAQSALQFPPGVTGITSAAPSTPETWSVLDKTNLSGLIEVYGATEPRGIGFRSAHDSAFELLPHLDAAHKEIFPINGEGMPLDIQDDLAWVGPRHFEVTGRIDKMVQVAGVNVSPAHVARVISSIACVKEAKVRMNGDRLQALIVPTATNEPTDVVAKRVREHIVRSLPAPARPATITFATSLPVTDMGKVMDWT